MLPAAHRLRRSGDFAATVRRGRRAARGCVVVHLLRPTSDSDVPREDVPASAAGVNVTLATSNTPAAALSAPVCTADECAPGADVAVDLREGRAPVGVAEAEPARAGFVVSKAVGGAVVRNKVKRRLRHLMAERIDRLPPGATIVVRAQPSAALRRYQEMAIDLEDALDAALRSGRRQ